MVEKRLGESNVSGQKGVVLDGDVKWRWRRSENVWRVRGVT